MKPFGLLEFLKQVDPNQVGKTLDAVHYSNQDGILRRLDPNAYGSGNPGAEWGRLQKAPELAPRTHFYRADSRQQPNFVTPRPESVVSGAPYAGRLTKIYDIKENPLGLKLSGNELERALIDMGFNGYTEPNSGIIVNLQGSPEVQKLGRFRGEAEENIARASRLPNQPSIITAENIPTKQSDIGAWLNKQPMDIRERYTDELEQLLDKFGLMKELGVKDYQINQGYGGYDGGTNPNTIIRVPDDSTAQRVATARGVITQQDAVPYYRADEAGDTQGIRATMREGVNPEVLEGIRKGTGQDYTRSDLNTVDFLNYGGADDFDRQISQYLAELDGTESISPFQATSNYNETGGISPTPEGVRLLEERPGLGEIRAGVDEYSNRFRKQRGSVNPLLLAGMAGGGLMALASNDAEANSYDAILKELKALSNADDDLSKIDFDALDAQVAASYDDQMPSMKDLKAIEDEGLEIDIPPPRDPSKGLPPELYLPVSDDEVGISNRFLEELMNDPERRALAEKRGFKLDDPMYHGTRSLFDFFDPKKVDVGSHMGDRKQATNRLNDTRAYDRDEENIIPLLHRTSKPLEMPDVGNWEQADAVLMELAQGSKLGGNEYPPGPWRELADLAVRQRQSFNSPGEWTMSPENRELLDRVNRELSMRGYDSIKYVNTVEAGQGLRPEFKKEYDQARAEYEGLNVSLKQAELANRPAPKPEDFDTEQAFRDAQYDHAVYQREAPETGYEDMIAKRDAAFKRMNEISSDPKKQFAQDSLIVLDPKDIRHPAAKFDPKKQQSSNLLASITGAGGTGLLGALAASMTPQDAQAAMMEETLPSAAASAEQYGRFGAQGLMDMLQGTDAPDLQGETFKGTDQMRAAMSTLFDPLKEGAVKALRGAQDAAYPYVSSALDYQPPLSQEPIGGQLQGIFDAIGKGWDSLDEDTQTRLKGAGAVGLVASDLIPGGKTVKEGAEQVFDPRYFNRVSDQKAAQAGQYVTPEITSTTRDLVKLPERSLREFENQPFVASISDRTAGGKVINEYNGKELPIPVDTQGGQEAMQEARNAAEKKLWMSDKGPANGILKAATEIEERTGIPPVFMPWRMTPTGSLHSTHTGDLMLSNMLGTMPKKDIAKVDDMIRGLTAKRTFTTKGGGKEQKVVNVGIPNWPGLAKDPEKAMAAWANATGKQRKAVKELILDHLRDQTGMSRSDALLAVTDPKQLNAEDFMFQNIGRIDTKAGLGPRSHNTYGATIYGTPEGRLKEQVSIFDLVPDLMDKVNPRRSAETRAVSGIITPELLDMLGIQ